MKRIPVWAWVIAALAIGVWVASGQPTGETVQAWEKAETSWVVACEGAIPATPDGPLNTFDPQYLLSPFYLRKEKVDACVLRSMRQTGWHGPTASGASDSEGNSLERWYR